MRTVLDGVCILLIHDRLDLVEAAEDPKQVPTVVELTISLSRDTGSIETDADGLSRDRFKQPS